MAPQSCFLQIEHFSKKHLAHIKVDCSPGKLICSNLRVITFLAIQTPGEDDSGTHTKKLKVEEMLFFLYSLATFFHCTHEAASSPHIHRKFQAEKIISSLPIMAQDNPFLKEKRELYLLYPQYR